MIEIEDEIAKVMNRGSNRSVTPDGIIAMTEMEFSGWLDRNGPLRKAIRCWIVSSNAFSNGWIKMDLDDYLMSLNYIGGSCQELFAEYLTDVRAKFEEALTRAQALIREAL